MVPATMLWTGLCWLEDNHQWVIRVTFSVPIIKTTRVYANIWRAGSVLGELKGGTRNMTEPGACD